MKHARALLAALLLAPLAELHAADVTRIFCNPLNLDYGWAGKGHRHGADPVIVLFKDRYYLFATVDVPGYMSGGRELTAASLSASNSVARPGEECVRSRAIKAQAESAYEFPARSTRLLQFHSDS